MQIRNLFYKEKIITCIFILIAVIGGILIYIFLSRSANDEKIQGDFNEVLVASNHIAPGSFIVEENVNIQRIPKNIFSDLFISDIELIKNKIVIEAIESGEIISYSKFEDSEAFNKNNFSFSSYIPKDKKAVTIPVLYYGDPSMIKIGDKVDIISTYYNPDEDSFTARTILSDKEIIFISGSNKQDQADNDINDSKSQFELLDLYNGNLSDDDTGKLMITFYLNREETEDLFKNHDRGVLHLSICSSKA
ncbi:MAG TPA: Flp pilus assembly protein CpaB [Actinobacteria bacterium]|nr:Flp pilus assembly protein CpaB [Actinomycetota bacterium]